MAGYMVDLFLKNFPNVFNNGCTGEAKGFLDKPPTGLVIKSNLDKWGNIKPRSFYTAEETNNKIRRQLIQQEKMFAIFTSNKRSNSKMHEELNKL